MRQQALINNRQARKRKSMMTVDISEDEKSEDEKSEEEEDIPLNTVPKRRRGRPSKRTIQLEEQNLKLIEELKMIKKREAANEKAMSELKGKLVTKQKKKPQPSSSDEEDEEPEEREQQQPQPEDGEEEEEKEEQPQPRKRKKPTRSNDDK